MHWYQSISSSSVFVQKQKCLNFPFFLENGQSIFIPSRIILYFLLLNFKLKSILNESLITSKCFYELPKKLSFALESMHILSEKSAPMSIAQRELFSRVIKNNFCFYWFFNLFVCSCSN